MEKSRPSILVILAHRILIKLERLKGPMNENPFPIRRIKQQEILKILPPTDLEISNLQKYFEAGVTITAKLATVWDSSPVSTNQKIQKLVFQEGVSYNHKNGPFRTNKVNLVFAAIPQLNNVSVSDIT
jgi:hypothetical protein